MIQERMQARNIDSKHRLVGFDYCAIALQQRVLQHNRHLTDIRCAAALCLLLDKSGQACILACKGHLKAGISGHPLITLKPCHGAKSRICIGLSIAVDRQRGRYAETR